MRLPLATTLAATLLCVAAVRAQNPCPDGGIGSPVLHFALDPVTGVDGHLGVAVLRGEYFVTARGAFALPPHRVHVFDAAGSLLRSFDQPPATAASLWGLRDLATDGVNLFGGDENGIHGMSPNGAVVSQVVAANGVRALPNLAGTPAHLAIGTFRALAFDRRGNGGEGSFWAANDGSDLIELALSGTVLRRFRNTTGWSIFGLALDDCAGTLWANGSGSGDALLEISRATGAPTGRTIPAAGRAGGLAIFTAAGGIRTHFARVDQTGPDAVHVGVLHQVPTVCDGLVLHSQVDSGGMDRGYKLLGAGASRVTFMTHGTPRNAPMAFFFNFGPDALLCGDVSYLGPAWRALADLEVAFGVSRPTGIAIEVAYVTGVPLTLQASAFPSNSAHPLRVQGVWLDPRVPGAYLPVLATNEVELRVDRRPPIGVVVEARGSNSFNIDTTSGFFAVTNPTPRAITRVRLEAVGGMVFDFAQIGMVDRFDGGNSTRPGCSGTFRNGSDVTAGIDYASTPASPCDPGARQAHLETTSPSHVLTLPFSGGAFVNGVTAEWDVDTDGGLGIGGDAMAGMRVTIVFANGDRRDGMLSVDPNAQDRAFVIL